MGSKLVATTSSLSYTDEELSNSYSYYYTVVPKIAGDTCTGPASSCTVGTPTPGIGMAVAGHTGAVTINTGDGDAFVDSCEEVTFCVEVHNVGVSALSNISIVGASSPSHPLIDPTISYTGLGGCQRSGL